MKLKYTSNSFILKAMTIHGGDYDYSKTIYAGAYDKIIIICKTCNKEFAQTANSHLCGCGCPDCGKIKKAINNTFSTEEYIEKAVKVHGEKYDYSKVVYVNSKTKIIIICKKCNYEFAQAADIHLWKCGCPKCAKNIKLTTETYIEKAIKVHGEKYDYSKVIYAGSKTKIFIICKKCNYEFTQGASTHLSGQGCPECGKRFNSSKPETAWIDSFNNPNIIRNKVLILPNGFRIQPDGYDPITKTIYEFLGDFWHGNPRKFNPEEINPKCKCAYGELYQSVLNKSKKILENEGHTLVTIWEMDWKKQLKESKGE